MCCILKCTRLAEPAINIAEHTTPDSVSCCLSFSFWNLAPYLVRNVYTLSDVEHDIEKISEHKYQHLNSFHVAPNI